MDLPRLSLVILTRNEEANIEACLASVARQTARDFEVILVDAASTDQTVARARAAQAQLGVPMRIVASDRLLPIGEARNMGVEMAQAPAVAFLSADAELDAKWIERAMEALRSHHMVFGRQEHAPHRWTLGAAVRGLRYHFPDNEAAEPLPFASNVAAAYDKRLLLEFPFDADANAAEDLLLAQRAARAGYLATYDPRLVVHHHDVASWREELRKNVREGHGCAVYADELGVSRPWLAWSGLLAACTATAVAAGFAGKGARSHAASTTMDAVAGKAARAAAGAALVVLWLPSLRRAVRRRKKMPRRAMAVAVAASPVFDLAFLVQYLRGLAMHRRHAHAAHTTSNDTMPSTPMSSPRSPGSAPASGTTPSSPAGPPGPSTAASLRTGTSGPGAAAARSADAPEQATAASRPTHAADAIPTSPMDPPANRTDHLRPAPGSAPSSDLEVKS